MSNSRTLLRKNTGAARSERAKPGQPGRRVVISRTVETHFGRFEVRYHATKGWRRERIA